MMCYAAVKAYDVKYRPILARKNAEIRKHISDDISSRSCVMQTITATTDTTGTFCLGLSTASEQSKPSCVRANVRDGDVATGVELEAALAKIGAEVR